MTKPADPQFRSISSGNKRWLPKEDDRLLDMVREKEDWVKIAKTFNRTFASVQNRFRYLKNSQIRAATIRPRLLTRAQDASLEPDLTCGALSSPGRRVLELVKGLSVPPASRARSPLTRTDFVIAAVIREILLMRLNSNEGWLRVTVSVIRSKTHGIGREALRCVIDDLESRALIERHVGYLGMPGLPNEARSGRIIWIRASSRLVDLCDRQGINSINLFTHFPSLRA
jgi:hypothetical protein